MPHLPSAQPAAVCGHPGLPEGATLKSPDLLAPAPGVNHLAPTPGVNYHLVPAPGVHKPHLSPAPGTHQPRTPPPSTFHAGAVVTYSCQVSLDM